MSLFKRLYKMTSVTKLRNFQYRLLLGKIFTNSILYKWKIVSSPGCNLCNAVTQTVEHVLWDCPYAQRIWQNLTTMCDINLDINKVMQNTICTPDKNIHNLVVLIVKQYLFRCKCEGTAPSEARTLTEIRTFFKIEMYDAKVNCKTKQLLAKWSPLSPFIM